MWSRRMAIGSSALISLAGLALSCMHYFAGASGDPEGWIAGLGFGAPFVAVGFIMMIGVRTGPGELVLVSSLVLSPMCVVSVILFPLPVLCLPALVYVANSRQIGQRVLVPAAVCVPLPLVFAVVVFHQDPASWTTPTGGGSSSNIITDLEAGLSLIVCLACVVAAWLWARAVKARCIPPPEPGAQRFGGEPPV